MSTVPMHITRAPKARSDMSPARAAIEVLLQTNTQAFTIDQIATSCRLPNVTTLTILRSLRDDQLVTNGTDTADGHSTWQWTEAKAPAASVKVDVVAPPRPPMKQGDYDGRELQAFVGRPGAMDAFALPSVHNGQRVERRTPLIMASAPDPRKAP